MDVHEFGLLVLPSRLIVRPSKVVETQLQEPVMNTSTVITRSVEATAAVLIVVAEFLVFQLGTLPIS